MTKTISSEQALDRLMVLCARSEQCTHQLRQKLRRWGIATNDAENIIKNLKDHRYVDDVRFAKSFIHDKISLARWGQRKVMAALGAYGMPSLLIQELLDDYIDPEEIERNLLQILQAKAKTIDEPKTYEGRTRLYRYALSRGYLPSTISKIIKTHFV